eukprot:TRINITY_DN762_c0_g1_i1.p1 TRINITY_DN762_c0_g1~~TRINITY_DN762_c0_g1_i1.p1  ORF type:complete len:162 (+),score=21.34 TRINITY_DN762_c0_g1_i1:137-622(+)
MNLLRGSQYLELESEFSIELIVHNTVVMPLEETRKTRKCEIFRPITGESVIIEAADLEELRAKIERKFDIPSTSFTLQEASGHNVITDRQLRLLPENAVIHLLLPHEALSHKQSQKYQTNTASTLERFERISKNITSQYENRAYSVGRTQKEKSQPHLIEL